jgi:hypothetical protein
MLSLLRPQSSPLSVSSVFSPVRLESPPPSSLSKVSIASLVFLCHHPSLVLPPPIFTISSPETSPPQSSLSLKIPLLPPAPLPFFLSNLVSPSFSSPLQSLSLLIPALSQEEEEGKAPINRPKILPPPPPNPAWHSPLILSFVSVV